MANVSLHAACAWPLQVAGHMRASTIDAGMIDLAPLLLAVLFLVARRRAGFALGFGVRRAIAILTWGGVCGREGRRVHGAVGGRRWRWGRRIPSVAPASNRYGIVQRGRCLASAVARTFHPDIWSSVLGDRLVFPASFWAAASRPMMAAGRMRTVSKIGTRQMAGKAFVQGEDGPGNNRGLWPSLPADVEQRA